jgi:hypothetical protein
MVSPFDTSTPNVARMYNVLLGGKDNFAADRAAVVKILEIEPGAVFAAKQNRDFLRRSVRFIAGESGIRQFLDIGSGLPTAENVHEVAQSLAPESRVVYVDNDSVVLSHARALLASNAEGKCDYVDTDLRDTANVITNAAKTLDFDKPIAVLLVAVLHFITDGDDPWEVIRRLMAAVPSGSYLAVSHATSDQFADATNKDMLNAVYSETASGGVTPRSFQEIMRFFNEQELIDPGLVDISTWRPIAHGAGRRPSRTLFYGGVARKP